MNSLSLLKSPCEADIFSVLAKTKRDLLIASPFITTELSLRLLERLSNSVDLSKLKVSILTDIRPESLLSGSLDVEALRAFRSASPKTEITYLPRLHAKVYVTDDKAAIVTSANLTAGGFRSNFEYGVIIESAINVANVRNDMADYALLGSSVSDASLEALSTAANELRQLYKASEQNLKKDFRKALKARLSNVNEELLTVRAAGKSTHAIFAQAILFLLAQRPMRTVDLQPAIQQMHPDLCNDSEDRVIGDVHFGKKWKHYVRTSQVYLRRGGKIELRDGLWHLIRQS